MSTVTEISRAAFSSEVEQHQGRVLVDFFAPWCGPCKMIMPLVEQLAESEPDLKVVKINADDASDLMAKFGIRGIPALMVFEDGELKHTKIGAMSGSALKAFALQ